MPVAEILKTLFILLVVVGGLAPLITWIERKQSAVMQDRIGANRADIGGLTLIGLFHPLADVLKLLGKEDFVPAGANRVLHLLAPLIAAIPAVIAFAVIPYGGVYRFGDHTLSLVVSDADWGMLYIFAIASLATYGTVIAGWSSNNGWSLLGSMRASAQMISYEVTMGLSLVGIFMVFQTLKLQDMALAQDTTLRVFGFLDIFFGLSHPAIDWIRLPAWGVFYQPLAFLLFLTCIMAENKRPPFDLPEGESEIIAGYHLEYSGMRFGLFFMSEFIQVVVIAGLMTALFLGGWSIPYLSTQTIVAGVGRFMGTGFATGLCVLLHFAAFMLKLGAMIWFQMALRWTLPRFRYDQVMDLCWKVILPLSIANVLVTGLVMLLVQEAA
ncbi:MAG: NADH-quinone oxidoreductase subunit H [Deltaproteobacteria bacterium]|nr:NADH-quinone oxidoreductase subunit H [Deltaproteobacteria bacterium]MBW2360700.1 NADH-quinone oxidoreductase subunit H [Deltaproteobacteria bacterium]